MIYTSSHKLVCMSIGLMLISFFSTPLVACTGTSMVTATSFYESFTDETSVEFEFCLGVTDLFGLPSDFTFTFEGTSNMPMVEPNATTLSAAYSFSEDAVSAGFFCNCNDNNIGNAPTILTNTDTWTVTAGPGEISYDLSRSDSRLIHECQIDCVNGEPTNATGGSINYLTDISACYVMTVKFAGDLEGQITGISLSGAENGLCDSNTDMQIALVNSLPAEFGSIEGISQENSVLINWTTLSENNVYKYVVERSPDGLSAFEEIGSVGVFGNSQAVKAYSFEDRVPVAKGFYRLKTVDIDGSIGYSQIILVEREIKDISINSVFPNPVVGPMEIIYETKALTNIHFKIFDVNGTLQADRILEAVNGFNKIDFDFSDLQEGLYFIVFETGKDRIVRRVTKF